MRRGFHILATALGALSLVVLLAVLVVPRLIGLEFDPVVSGSMEPTIKTGATIAIARVDPARVHVGDIIGFRVPGIDKPICHRVTEVVSSTAGYGFRTRGDANEDPDPWVVSPGDVLGRVYFNTSVLLPVARFNKTPLGFVLLEVLPAVIVGGLAVKEIWQVSRRRRPAASPNLAPKVD
jgi:signal peptidase I